MKLELQATPQEVMRAVAALQDFGQTKGVPDNALFALALALEECGSNIVNHALQRDPQAKFQVAFEHTGSAVIIELRDRGPEFDPTQAAALPTIPDEEVGGWGIQLVWKYMDEMRYRREEGQNVLRLIKHLRVTHVPE